MPRVCRVDGKCACCAEMQPLEGRLQSELMERKSIFEPDPSMVILDEVNGNLPPSKSPQSANHSTKEVFVNFYLRPPDKALGGCLNKAGDKGVAQYLITLATVGKI